MKNKKYPILSVIIIFIVSLSMFLLACLLLFNIGVAAVNYIRLSAFQVTEGKIVNSGTKLQNLGSGIIAYLPDIKYTYNVGTEFYSNNIISFNPIVNTRSFKPAIGITPAGTQEALDKYYLNKKVSVYYNKLNPKESVLEKNVSLEFLIFLLPGILFLVIGFVGIKFSIKYLIEK